MNFRISSPLGRHTISTNKPQDHISLILFESSLCSLDGQLDFLVSAVRHLQMHLSQRGVVAIDVAAARHEAAVDVVLQYLHARHDVLLSVSLDHFTAEYLASYGADDQNWGVKYYDYVHVPILATRALKPVYTSLAS